MQQKITLLSAFLFIGFMAANAQFTTGKYLLGGDLYFQTENGKDVDYKNEGANVTLKFGKVIKENTIVGLNLVYGYSSFDNQGDQIQNSNNYGGGIFYRKYKTLSKDFHLFGETGLNYSYGEYKNNYSGSNIWNKTITNGVNINFMPGLSYSLNNKVKIELLMPNLLGIGYTHSKYSMSNSPDETKNNFSFFTNIDGNLLSNFGVGFKFLLGK